MEELYTAFTLSLIGLQRFVIHTNDYANTTEVFSRLILRESCNFGDEDIVEINLQEHASNDELLLQMMSADSQGVYTFKKVIIWRNLENLAVNSQQRRILTLLNEIDQYDTVQSRIDQTISSVIKIGSYSIIKPSTFIIIPIIAVTEERAKFHQNIKGKFWFSQFYYFESLKVSENDQIVLKCPSDEYSNYIAQIRQNTLPKIHVSPEMQRFIYSLIVFTRCHRLCSLAPIQTRLPTRTIDSITLLTKCLVAFNYHDSQTKLYATPEFGKIAYKKIAYWLVDWEHNKLFARDDDSRESTPSFDQEEDNEHEEEYRQRYEISMLTGDWYGSEWKYAKNLINDYHSRQDFSSSVGFTNQIVEDVLKSVKAPL